MSDDDDIFAAERRRQIAALERAGVRFPEIAFFWDNLLSTEARRLLEPHGKKAAGIVGRGWHQLSGPERALIVSAMRHAVLFGSECAYALRAEQERLEKEIKAKAKGIRDANSANDIFRG